MVAALESELGVKLFERERGSVSLTPEGKELLPYAANLCEDADLLAERSQAMKGLETGRIRIGAFTSVATHWLPKVIAGFRADYPGIEYELQMGDYTEIEAWLAEGRVDCGFVRLPVQHKFEKEELAHDEFMAILPQNHDLASCDAFPISCFADEPFLELASPLDSEVGFIFKREGMSVRPVFSTWDDYSIMAMVESGLGLAILP